MNSCSSSIRRRAKALAWNSIVSTMKSTIEPLTDGTATSMRESELYKFLNRNDGVGLFFLPFMKDGGEPLFQSSMKTATC